MAHLFPSDAWVRALMEVLNDSEAYAQAASRWEGDCYFTIEDGQGPGKAVNLWLDLWHGECREAYEVGAEDGLDPAFRFSAPLAVYRKIFDRKLDPIRALMTRQLKLSGDMRAIMRAPKAAQELVACCTRVDTVYAEQSMARLLSGG